MPGEKALSKRSDSKVGDFQRISKYPFAHSDPGPEANLALIHHFEIEIMLQ